MIQKNKLGVVVRDLTYEEKSNPNIDRGVFVENVELDGLAAKVGIRKGDIITYIGNRKIKNKQEFASAIDSASPDKAISIGLVRNGVQRFLSLRLTK